MKALFDTNILIDYLLGVKQAKDEFKLYEELSISIITKMEVMVGCSEKNEEMIKDFLSNFNLLELNNEIANIAVQIRKSTKIKLPDAIIWATAKYNNSLLITRNIKDFSLSSGDIKIPY